MDSRASTRTRLSVLPVFIALIFNLMAPVLSIAAPEGAPGPLAAPEAAIAVSEIDPVHVSFVLEGCKDPSVDLEDTNFVCADDDYTTGNLGKSWNELDLVPHRLTTSLGSQDAATTTYDVAIVADHIEGGAPGYDIISVPVINEALSHESCEIEATGGAVGDTVSPGIGGTDTSLYRILTITQDPGTTCVFDYYERLALGSHLFPGASLHSNLTNQDLGTQGVGARDVSIPVMEIEPQELDKDMTATQGQAHGWTVEKSADPGSLHFANTCLDTEGARSAQVEITIEWTRSGPTASGDTMVTTNIYATNPAHRVIQVNVTDKIYAGADQSVLLDTVSSGAVNVAAGAADMLVLTHQFAYDGVATSFNDVATATYTDLVTGIPVPGQTTASASATTTASDGAIENASVLVTDTEAISGAGLTFSVAEPTIGEFTNYTAGDSTTGPVNWQYTATESGSVTFSKTVTVDEPRIITNGSLSDTATIVGDDQLTLDSDMESVGITADAAVSLTINKTIPAGALRSGESVTFDFDITGPDGFEDTAQITFTFGGSTTGSVTLPGLDPGDYTVSEQAEPGWATQGDQTISIDLPDCTGSVSFTNTELAPDLSLTKNADAASVSAGDPIGFEIVVSNDGEGTAKDVTLSDPLPFGPGIDWTLDSVTGTGGYVATGTCEITGDATDEAIGQDLDCDFGDLAPGQGVEIEISSDTDASSCAEYFNEATVNASNHASLDADDTTLVECPGLNLVKTADADPIDAGEEASFTILIWNRGPGTALDATFSDELPAGLSWSFELINADDDDVCASSINSDEEQAISCEFGDLAPSLMPEAPYSAESTGKVIRVWAETDRTDCGLISNTAFAGASNNDDHDSTDTITVKCPLITLDKENDAVGSILPGTSVTYTLTLTVDDGPAEDVMVVDSLPVGLESPTNISNGGVFDEATNMISWDLGELADGEYSLSYQATVADDVENGDELVNAAAATSTNSQCPDLETLGPECEDDSTVIVRVPTLVIDKVADAELITISGEAGDLEASPSVVTWTLTYTLTNGPVTNAVITDEIPAGFVFLDASDGGLLVDDTVTWTVATLSASGSVTFRTTVDPETISRVAPTVNVAVIDSDDTEPDEGQDSVTVVVEPPVLGGNPTPTPKPNLPDTASGIGLNGEPVTVPLELLVALFVASLGAMTLANVKARSRRR